MKRAVRRLFTLLPALLLGLPAGCAPAMHPHQGAARPDAHPLPADSALLEAALVALRIAPAMAGVWPGFWPPEQPFILYRPGEAVLLVTPGGTPAGLPQSFLPLRGGEVPAELRGRAHLHRGALPGLEGSFQIDFPVGAVTATAVALDSEGVAATLATLFHEAFHGYQQRSFQLRPDAAGEFVDPAHIAAPEFRAMAEVERRMLAESLGLPVELLPDHLRRYLAVRQMRAGSVPDQVTQVERKLERSEGSAHLVGLEGGLRAAGAGPAQLPEALLPYLTRPLDSFAGGLSEQLIRWRVYGTGAAIGLALDRLGAEWRRALEEGAAFDALLAAAIGFDAAAAPGLAAEALEGHGFAGLLAAAAAAGVAPGVRTLDDFHALESARLVVVLPVVLVDGRPELSLNFSGGTGGSGGFSQIEPNLFLITDAEVVTVQAGGASLVVRSRPVLLDLRGLGEGGLRVTVMLPGLPAPVGEPGLAEGEHRREGLRIAELGVELTLVGPLTLSATPGEMVVRPRGSD